MNRSAFSQCSSGVVMWTNAGRRFFSSILSERKSLTQRLSNSARISLANSHEKKKKLHRRVDAYLLLQGISEAAKETTDLAKDCCVLTYFPEEDGTPNYLGTGWKVMST